MLKGQLPNGFWPFFLCKYTKFTNTIDFFVGTDGFMDVFHNDVLIRNHPCPIMYIVPHFTVHKLHNDKSMESLIFSTK